MVIQVLHCAHCQSQNVIRQGKDKVGRQRYRCHDCRRTFQDAQEQAHRRARRAETQARALAAYQERLHARSAPPCAERASMRGARLHARSAPPCAERASMRGARLHARSAPPCAERASMRGVCRLFGIGRNTLSGWLKDNNQKSPPVAAPHADAGPARP